MIIRRVQRRHKKGRFIRMKRILALLLAGALLCTLTGCSTVAD